LVSDLLRRELEAERIRSAAETPSRILPFKVS
jgi:hypothetical protein